MRSAGTTYKPPQYERHAALPRSWGTASSLAENGTGDGSIVLLMASSKIGSLGGLGADQDDAEDKQDCPGKSRQTRRVLWDAE
jgi:hypothetical protein